MHSETSLWSHFFLKICKLEDLMVSLSYLALVTPWIGRLFLESTLGKSTLSKVYFKYKLPASLCKKR